MRCLRGCCPVSGCLCSSSSSCCCCPAVLRFLPAFVDALLLVTVNKVLSAVAAAPKLTAAAALLSLPKASSTQLGRAEAVYEAAGPGVLKLRVGLANEARLDDGTGAFLRGVAGAAVAADAGAASRAAKLLLLPSRSCCCCCGFFLLLACFLGAGAG